MHALPLIISSSPATPDHLWDVELTSVTATPMPGMQTACTHPKRLQQPSESILCVAGGDAAAGGIKLAVQFPGSADINPVQYVQGLAKAVAARGGRIFENSRVKVTGDNKCIGAPSLGCGC